MCDVGLNNVDNSSEHNHLKSQNKHLSRAKIQNDMKNTYKRGITYFTDSKVDT